MTAVEEIVARLLRIVPARIAYAVVDGVVPVKIVICVRSVPTSVMRLESVMRPTNTGICASNHDGLSFESQRPYVRRMCVNNSRLDRRRRAGLQRRLLDRASLRKIIVNVRIACDARHVWTGRQRLGKLAVSFHQNCVNDIERLILDLAFAQPLQDWLLRALGLFQQGLINEPALFGFSWQISGRTEIGLICQHDKKISLLAVGSLFHYPRRDLLHRRRMKRALRRQLNALADSARRSDGPYQSDSSCSKQQ